MPKLAPEKQTARREHILNAAERCFAGAGFHATTMHDICAAADVSPGALYTYFKSKEDLIEGLCEREKERFGRDLARLAEAPDFFAALQAMAEQYCCNEPLQKVRLHVEIGAEAGRNEAVGKTVRAIDAAGRQSISELLERERARGRISLNFPIETVVRAMCAMGDGMFWNRALDPTFDPRPIIPAMMAMVSSLIVPVPPRQDSKEHERCSK